LVEEYFRQEHFSLKRLLSSISTETCEPKLAIVHTRSENLIHTIPCLSADRTSDNVDVLETVRKLVHNIPEQLVIENLNRTRSEGTMRASIQAWVNHQSRKLYLILVDMSQDGSFDRGTFMSYNDFERYWDNLTKLLFLIE
jgi:hypothetical protein